MLVSGFELVFDLTAPLSEANTRNIMCLAKASVINRVKITVMLQLYQKCVVPALIHSAETWQNYQDYSKQMEEINYNNTSQKNIESTFKYTTIARTFDENWNF